MYLTKARESLAGVESEFAAGRFNNCANRAYYAWFQAAIAALLREGIQATGGLLAHAFVQSRFVGQAINRRHRYPTTLRSVLTDLLRLRQRADYGPEPITETDATRGLRRSRALVEAVRQEGAGQR